MTEEQQEKPIVLETKGPSLIGKGWIDPTDAERLPVAIEDIGTVLEVTPEEIEPDSIQRWPHMLRVHLKNGQYRCVSYRALPGWADAGEAAIKRCATLEQLDEFAAVVNAEKKRFEKKYPEATLKRWREVWRKQRQIVQYRECVRQKKEEHRLAGIQWKNSWYGICRYCHSRNSLMALWVEWEKQKVHFADLPVVISETEQILLQRWQELSQAS